MDILEYIKALPRIPKNKRGIPVTSKCPCGGIITAKRSKYNGHMWAKCDTCKFRMME